MDIFDKIAEYIVKNTQTESNPDMSGFQLVTSFAILNEYQDQLNVYIRNQVRLALESREEVADVQLDKDGFDVCLYTNFAPNYRSEQYEDK